MSGFFSDDWGRANWLGLTSEWYRFVVTWNAEIQWHLEHSQDWAANRQDTLIIVMADHETGGFGFNYSGENIPRPHQLPGVAFADGTLFQPNFNFGNPDVLDKLSDQQLSYRDIFAQFNALPKGLQTPVKLNELVNRFTTFKITEAQAQKNPASYPTGTIGYWCFALDNSNN